MDNASAAAVDATPATAAEAAGLHGAAFRRLVRQGRWHGPTAGVAAGHVQANLVVLPAALADAFLRFCQANPKPCPLLGVTEPGSPHLPALGADLDLRTDLPGYRVWQDGALSDEPDSLQRWWRDDLVGFAIGCSFSFEEALLAEGIEIRHIRQGRNVPMYRTHIATQAAGPFHGPLVVSMRPLKAADAIRAVQITSRFPSVHGAPVHLGDPAQIGIADLARPDYGDAVDIQPGELPVFWACGVTPQAVVAASRPALCITHRPGHMLVTDLDNRRLAVF